MIIVPLEAKSNPLPMTISTSQISILTCLGYTPTRPVGISGQARVNTIGVGKSLSNRAGAKGSGAPVNALLRSYPELRTAFPLFPLTSLPTPVEPSPSLGAEVGLHNLWIKRDDKSGIMYGGNKPRKLELIIGRARERGAERIITFGGLGTNHGLATALAARAAGIPLTLLLVHQPVTDAVRLALRRFAALQVELIYGAKPARVAALTVAAALRYTATSGRPPMIVPAGGSSRLGTVGQIAAALELAQQVEEGRLPPPEAVFVATGSGGTLAGLAAGMKLTGLSTRLIGVLVSDIMPPTRASISRLANRTIAMLRAHCSRIPPVKVKPQDITLVTTELGGGYGTPTAAGQCMLELARRKAKIALDPVYTAKAFAGMASKAPSMGLREKPVVFWLTYSSIDPTRFIGELPSPARLPYPLRSFFPS